MSYFFSNVSSLYYLGLHLRISYQTRAVLSSLPDTRYNFSNTWTEVDFVSQPAKGAREQKAMWSDLRTNCVQDSSHYGSCSPPPQVDR